MNTAHRFILSLTAAASLLAHSQIQPAAEPSYSQNPDAVRFMQELSGKDGFDENYLQQLLAAAQRDDSVLEKISRPAEKTKPWYEYAKIFDGQDRAENGAAFYQANRQWFDKAYADYGVDPFIIAGILGVETRYGKVTGSTGVFRALATLCFDYPKRAEFFCSELEHYLQLAKRENWQPLSTQGSYAGAMGMGQFMPSSYLNDAVDFDGDGHVNLWNSSADAVGSIANYLKNRGWQKDGAIYQSLPAKPALSSFDGQHKPSYSLKALIADENLKTNEKFIKWLEKQPDETVGSLILQGETSELPFITYNNFYVITRYNTSPMYAMAVSNLAKRIRYLSNNQESPND